MTDQSYRWSEEAVAHLLGITKRDVKRLRKERLVPIDQVEIVAGVHMITDSGLKALGDFMKVTLPADLFSEKKDAPATPSEAQPVNLVVERLCPNPTWVMVRFEGALVQCRVQNNLVMHRGKKIAAVRVGEHFRMVRGRV